MLDDPLAPHPRARRPREISATSPSWSIIEGRTSTSTPRPPILKIPRRPRFGVGLRSKAAIAPGSPTGGMTERLSRSVLVCRKRLAAGRQSPRATAGSMGRILACQCHGLASNFVLSAADCHLIPDFGFGVGCYVYTPPLQDCVMDNNADGFATAGHQ